MAEVHAIETRQKCDQILRNDDPLATGDTLDSQIWKVSGYAVINILIFSDQAFRLRVDEAPTLNGPWSESQRFNSALNSAGTEQQICRRIAPCGPYMRFHIDNTSGVDMTSFEAVIEGLPIGDLDETNVNVHITNGGGAAQTGQFDNGAVDETSIGLFVRSGTTAYDGSRAVNTRNIPIEARAAVAAQAYALERLLVDSVVRGDDGATYSAVAARAAGAAHSEALLHLLSSACVYGYDASAAVGSRDVPVEARLLALSPGIQLTARGLVTYAVNAGYDPATALIQTIAAEVPSAISGRSASTPRALYAAAIATGLDNTGAAVLRPVEARALSGYAAAATSIIGLLTSSYVVARYNGGATIVPIDSDYPSTVSGIAANTRFSLYTNSLCVGLDNTGAAVLRPVEARNFDTESDSGVTLYGLVTNARLSALVGTDATGATMARLWCDAPSSVSGRLTGGVNALWANALNVGVDNTGAAVLRPVEARNFDANADIAGALIGLTTNSRMAFYSPADVDWVLWAGTFYPSVANSIAERAYGAYIYQARDTGFAAARRGKRFYTTNPTAGTPLTCQTAFVETTPSLMLRINSANIRAIVRSLSLTIANTPGAMVNVAIVLDTADRWSAGGTVVTQRNTNEESATAAVSIFYENPTANASGGGTRLLLQDRISNVDGTFKNFNFDDSILLGISAATLLIYIYSATTAPDVFYNLDIEEVS